MKTIDKRFYDLDMELLSVVDGGTFWGVVNGVFTTMSGGAQVVGGAALLVAPEPTFITKAAGISLIATGSATMVGGIATIANNL